ncbi:MAG: enolase C-terminal domain-like protein [Natrialbaceae archaeon]|nr:enolase C-terminal domain-like protein [Natrialbaceae archaeon]
MDRRDGILVWLEADGHSGVGEATPLVGFTESIDACRSALERARDCETIADALATTAGTPAAHHGIELADLDRRARADGVPLYSSLSSPSDRTAVPVNATIGHGTIEETRSAVRRAVAQGFRACKLKVGIGTLEQDLERVETARLEAGPSVKLRVDANGAWSLETALEAIEQLGGHDVSILEQPLPAAALDATDSSGIGVSILPSTRVSSSTGSMQRAR